MQHALGALALPLVDLCAGCSQAPAFLHYSFHHQTRPGNLQKIGSYYKQLAVHFVAAPLVMHDQA